MRPPVGSRRRQRTLAAGGIGYSTYCCRVLNGAEVYTPLTPTLTASALNFGVLQIGLTSSPQTVTVTNLSSHASTFARIATCGNDAQRNNCPIALNPGENCAIMVAFAPTASGKQLPGDNKRAADLHIRDQVHAA
jgi:hypothetical protein